MEHKNRASINKIRFGLIYHDEICEVGFKLQAFKRDLDQIYDLGEKHNRDFVTENKIYFENNDKSNQRN